VAKIDGVAIPVASDAPSARSPSFTLGPVCAPRMNTLPLGVVAWPNRSLLRLGREVSQVRGQPHRLNNDVAQH